MKGRTEPLAGDKARYALTAVLATVYAGLLLVPSLGLPASLSDEAARLRTANIKNFEGITSLSLSCRVTVTKLDSGGKAVMASAAASPVAEQSLWDRKGRKLKRKQGRGDIVATVADGQAAMLSVQTTSTVMVEPIPPEEVDSASTPSPFWFWRPDKFIPERPDGVREDGTALVLSSSQGKAKREIWLDRTSGRILRFEDTSPAGKKYRVVVCPDWKQIVGVWLPTRIEEEVRARLNGARRVIEFSDVTINPAIGGADFDLP